MNKTIKLKNKPAGAILESNFSLVEEKIPEPADGHVLVRVLWLSIDPALFGRLRDDDNYAEKVNPGDTMQCYGLAQALDSRSSGFAKGDIVFGNVGMQEYCCLPGKEFRKINPFIGQLSWNLSVLGLAGVTAYFGLLDIGKPKAGETLVVSAAAGSVGSLAGQIGKLKKCRVVGITGSAQKAEYITRELGFDTAVVYKNNPRFADELKAACPGGIDIYFDNVAGDMANVLLPLYNTFARIVLCGRMALANLDSADQDTGLRDTTVLLRKRIRKQGFVVIDFEKRYAEAILMLLKWLNTGKIKLREDVIEGLENAPLALLGLLEGKNTGKQLVKIAEPDMSIIKSGRLLGRALNSYFFPESFIASVIRWLN